MSQGFDPPAFRLAMPNQDVSGVAKVEDRSRLSKGKAILPHPLKHRFPHMRVAVAVLLRKLKQAMRRITRNPLAHSRMVNPKMGSDFLIATLQVAIMLQLAL
jgi:hypothetical protein